jgi:hypothetical protein
MQNILSDIRLVQPELQNMGKKHVLLSLLQLAIILSFSFTSSAFTIADEPEGSRQKGADTNRTSIIWPRPTRVTSDDEGIEREVDPCKITYILQSPRTVNMSSILDQYLTEVFGCQSLAPGDIKFTIVLKDPYQFIALTTDY